MRVRCAHNVAERVLIIGPNDAVLSHGGRIIAHCCCRLDDLLTERGIGFTAIGVVVRRGFERVGKFGWWRHDGVEMDRWIDGWMPELRGS